MGNELTRMGNELTRMGNEKIIQNSKVKIQNCKSKVKSSFVLLFNVIRRRADRIMREMLEMHETFET
jgi:hypothetical protein